MRAIIIYRTRDFIAINYAGHTNPESVLAITGRHVHRETRARGYMYWYVGWNRTTWRRSATKTTKRKHEHYSWWSGVVLLLHRIKLILYSDKRSKGVEFAHPCCFSIIELYCISLLITSYFQVGRGHFVTLRLTTVKVHLVWMEPHVLTQMEASCACVKMATTVWPLSNKLSLCIDIALVI